MTLMWSILSTSQNDVVIVKGGEADMGAVNPEIMVVLAS